MAYFKIMTLDGDLVNAAESSLEDAELELSYYDDEHCLIEITEDELADCLEELENDIWID